MAAKMAAEQGMAHQQSLRMGDGGSAGEPWQTGGALVEVSGVHSYHPQNNL